MSTIYCLTYDVYDDGQLDTVYFKSSDEMNGYIVENSISDYTTEVTQVLIED